MNELLWSPSKSKIENSNLYKFKNIIEKKYNLSFETNYQDLWKWSVGNNENFWSECWDFFKINGTKKEEIIKRNDIFHKTKFMKIDDMNVIHPHFMMIDYFRAFLRIPYFQAYFEGFLKYFGQSTQL